MLLVSHIFVAVLGLIIAAWSCISPARRLVQVAYVCGGLTVVSGLLLVVVAHAPALHTCMSALVYLAVLLACVTYAQGRLAHGK